MRAIGVRLSAITATTAHKSFQIDRDQLWVGLVDRTLIPFAQA